MGVRLGQVLQAQGIDQVDSTALAAAIDDVLAGRALRMSAEQMQAAVLEQRVERARANLAAGRAFLERAARQPGVVSLPNGLLYQVIAAGDGARPALDATVRVHYHGSRIDGSVFDSSVERGQPAVFRLNQVIPGFREAITRMRSGARWRIFVPSELAYGEHGAGTEIGPNEALVFEIDLLDILP